MIRRYNKLVILGKLETKYQAPFDDKSFDIWSMNKHKDADCLPRVDKWFDIHKAPENINADVFRTDFPFAEIHEKIGGKQCNNITSYLIYYAVIFGLYDEIHLYGMRFDPDHPHRTLEYHNVREAIAFARGKGCKIFDYDGVLTKEFVINEHKDYDN
jgi:hypothetical protein